jgi:DNA polymerase-1
MLKEKIIQVCEMLEEGGFKTRFQMNIHDELSFEVWEGEEYMLPTIKRIMEVAEWSKVPIVADVELTATTWADKEEVDIHQVYDNWYLKTYGEPVLF